MVVLVTELVGLSDINNHPFIVPPSDAVFSFRSFSREHDLATVKVGGKEAGLASCWLAICPRGGWISFFVIAESSELILCSMLETETTESMIIEWGRAVIDGTGLASRSSRIRGSGQFVPPPFRSHRSHLLCKLCVL